MNQNQIGTPSLRYWLARELETHVLRQADAVVAIASPMIEDLASRGIPRTKIFHVPNGVDAARFVPRPRDASFAAQLGVDRTPTLGFLGTLFPWEGVPWLVRGAAELRKRGFVFKLLIVGDGADTPRVNAAIQETASSNYISFLGRVSHDQVELYYSVMDVLVYPRCSARLTEMVTPLKPLEAMALGKPVLASDVGGLRELIRPDETGALFEAGNIEQFCRQAARLLSDESLRRSLGDRARRLICEEKDWRFLVRQYESIYQFAQRSRSAKG